MENNTALAASAGLVIVAALGSGALYVAATADDAPATPAPQAEVVVEYLDEQGNLQPVEVTAANSAENEQPEEYEEHKEDEEYEEHAEYEEDDEQEEDDEYEEGGEDHDDY